MNIVVATLLAAAFTAPPLSAVAERVAAPQTPWPQRLVDVTQPFVGAPYVLSPLGEGDGQVPDADPRFRVDAFDCTTFVESAMALSLGANLDDSLKILDAIRYRGGHVGFAQRRHFPEAEWIPELINAGLLVDITKEVGGTDVVVETKQLNAAAWNKTRHKGLPTLADERIPDGVFALNVWPLAAAAAHPERIPAGTILHLVRVDFATVPVRVSHQGLVVDVGGKRVMRHAADRMHHRVVDEPLEAFFARMTKYGKWPVTGVHLTRFQPAADWRLRLLVEEGVTPLPVAPLTPSSTTTAVTVPPSMPTD